MKYSILASLSLLGSALASVPPIAVKGSKFFYSNNGTEFYIRGVAYQPNYNKNAASSTSYVDPLADVESCKRDIPYLVGLRTNVVRTYAVDPSKNHDACMTALADAGIYVITDLASPTQSIIQQNPMWNADIFARYAQVVDAFQKYPNVIGFFVGNEVSNQVSNTDAMVYVKAAVRDMKSYVKQKNYRSSLAIGYATDDDATIRNQVKQYLVCDTPADSIDMFGYNIYEWCGQSSYETSGYEARTSEFSNYPVPAFFSEYGCNSPSPRHFTDVPVLFGPQMSNVWSGGIVYMYYETTNNYGLVQTHGNQVSTLPDYSYLSMQIQKATPVGVNSNAYTPTASAGGACPTVGNNWQAASALPPPINNQLCSCMYDSLDCVPAGNISPKLYSKTFSYLGGEGVLSGITGNGTSGTYGAYSMCNAEQRLAWAMNRYYLTKGKKSAKACNFNGAATLKSATSASGSCATQMSSIGAAGTGSVAGGGLGVGGSSGSASAATSSGLAGFTAPQAVHIGSWQTGAYMVAALASGVFMIML